MWCKPIRLRLRGRRAGETCALLLAPLGKGTMRVRSRPCKHGGGLADSRASHGPPCRAAGSISARSGMASWRSFAELENRKEANSIHSRTALIWFLQSLILKLARVHAATFCQIGCDTGPLKRFEDDAVSYCPPDVRSPPLAVWGSGSRAIDQQAFADSANAGAAGPGPRYP